MPFLDFQQEFEEFKIDYDFFPKQKHLIRITFTIPSSKLVYTIQNELSTNPFVNIS